MVQDKADLPHWEAAMATARQWVGESTIEIEAGELRVKVDPVLQERLAAGDRN